MRGAILVPSGPVFRLGQASLPLGRAPAAFTALLRLGGGAVAAFTVLALGGPGGLHRGDVVVIRSPRSPGLEGGVAPGVGAPRRGRQRPVAVGDEPALVVALGLLVHTALVPDPLALHALEDGALSVGAGSLQGGAHPLLFSTGALRLGQAHTPAHPPKLVSLSTDDHSLPGADVGSEGSHRCAALRGASLLAARQRLIHFSFNGVSCLPTFGPGL